MLPAHPMADLFPLMEESELQSLAEDIKANGQREPTGANVTPNDIERLGQMFLRIIRHTLEGAE